MKQAQREHGDRSRPSHRALDRGSTFVEILVSIVLIGTGVIATLVALRTTTTATITDRDHARAFEWLQAGADEVFNAPRVACYSEATPVASAAAAVVAYDAAADDATRPPGWAGATIEVIDVKFIGRASSADPYSWSSSFCLESNPGSCPTGPYCNSPQTAQKVTLRVTSANGLVKTLETVKGD